MTNNLNKTNETETSFVILAEMREYAEGLEVPAFIRAKLKFCS